MFNRILVPVDGSPASRRAAAVAADLAQRYSSRVTILYVTQFTRLTDMATSEQVRRELLEAVNSANQVMLHDMAGYFRAAAIPDDHVEIRQLEGSPDTVIARTAAEGFDLVVMGSRGLSLGEGELALLGSVTDRVLRRVGCPVLVVR